MNRARGDTPRAFSFGAKMVDPHAEARLRAAANIWLATVRPNGAPHLVPIWFVWLNHKAYLCTARRSVKARNIRANARVSFALEDGSDPLMIEGQAAILDEIPTAVAEAFQQKYDWQVLGDGTYDALVEITPTRVVM